MQVTKRDGSRETLDLEKFHRVCIWACEDLTGVSASEVEIRSNIQFYDGIKTSDIQETLIKAASELIGEDTPNYQYVAGRLINYHLRKEVYGGPDIPHLSDHIRVVVDAGLYDPIILEKYSPDDLEHLNSKIVHDRDFLIAYAGMEQWRGKYLVRNRTTNKYYETPQMAIMLIAAHLFADYPDDERLTLVQEYYDAVSLFDISLPTPIMSGVRTIQRQFSSCVVIETDDSLDSISASSHAILKYVSQRAGIGIGASRIRALHSPVRGGIASHTGIIPFIKLFEASVAACSQGGVRTGSATLHYPFFHMEFGDLIVLKNNKGTEESRVRHLDYSVQLNRLFYERFLQSETITLFSPSDVPDLLEAFYSSSEEFARLYSKYEKKSGIRKKKISSRDMMSAIMTERKDTGRIYIMNVDHCNSHGSFDPEVDPIRMSNLCQEITLPTTPLQYTDDPNGEIALCTLTAINWGKIKEPSDFERPCRLAVRALDALLDYQEYPLQAAAKARHRRSLGIGVINLAYFLAKNDITYQHITRDQLAFLHRYVEAWAYYITKASIDLAKERGKCQFTRYHQGIFPIDTYKKDVDGLVEPIYQYDWDGLRQEALVHGIRNSTLMALMPSETSSTISNATNGIEPVRSLVSIKQSKDGVLKQVVPEIRKLKNKYDLLWDQRSPLGYLKIAAVFQKFIDQSISVNTSYNPEHYPNNEIPMSVLIEDMLVHYKWGGKTLYYCNTYDGSGEISINESEDCDSCKI